ncbi:unnamed protein product [Durusdinium trenchii]|uniref:Glycosyltransferase 2-like domain-containing protein n=1 Tax=Durusdinium trenchii TaxID=1381693 RepID=A0ABP0RU67_9DINO
MVMVSSCARSCCLEATLRKAPYKEPTMSFRHFVDAALYTEKGPPMNPTWFYTLSRACGYNAQLQVLSWLLVLVPLTGILWHLASSSSHILFIFNLRHSCVLGACRVAYHLMIMTLAPWPAREEALQHENDPSYLKRIGCIIPCHKSATEVDATVQSLLEFLEPEHIIVVDNGNSSSPLDDTKKEIQELSPSVSYIWVPLGLKTNALWRGLQALPPEVEYVMHVDDDTVLPADMVFDESVWDHPLTDAVSYGITMQQSGLVEKLVDLEFKEISQTRLFQSQYSSVWFQHGIIGLWRREAFCEVLKEHPFMPFGEDNWNGTINLLRNRQMRQELRSQVTSYAPACLWPFTGSREQGYGAANLWKQRAERWFVNAPRRCLIRLYLLFFYCHDTAMGNLVFRLISLKHLFEIYIHLIVPLTLVAWTCSSEFDPLLTVEVLGVQIIFQWVLVFVENYVMWRHRPDIQVEFQVCLCQPFYHWFLQVCFWYGHWRCLFYYIPFFPLRHGLYTEKGVLTPHLLM